MCLGHARSILSQERPLSWLLPVLVARAGLGLADAGDRVPHAGKRVAAQGGPPDPGPILGDKTLGKSSLLAQDFLPHRECIDADGCWTVVLQIG